MKKFWNQLEDSVIKIRNEQLWIGGDLNGHVGKTTQGMKSLCEDMVLAKEMSKETGLPVL